MLTYQESVNRFKDLRSQLRIPPDAEFFSVEKRHIEQLPTGEIEDGEIVSGVELTGEPAGESDEPRIEERPVWVAEFTMGFMFWEVAIDAQGELVRLRKSR